MSIDESITEELILTKVSEKSFKRGEEYFNWGLVESVVRRGSRLFAQVLGSEEDAYQRGYLVPGRRFHRVLHLPL